SPPRSAPPTYGALGRAALGAVELSDRPSLVAELAQPPEDRAVQVQSLVAPRRDHHSGLVHLERDSGRAVGVEELQRSAVEREQGTDSGVAAGLAAAAPEAPGP